MRIANSDMFFRKELVGLLSYLINTALLHHITHILLTTIWSIYTFSSRL